MLAMGTDSRVAHFLLCGPGPNRSWTSINLGVGDPWVMGSKEEILYFLDYKLVRKLSGSFFYFAGIDRANLPNISTQFFEK